MKITRYSKFIVAFGAAVAALVASTADGDLTVADGVKVAVALAGALGVYAVPNKPAA